MCQASIQVPGVKQGVWRTLFRSPTLLPNKPGFSSNTSPQEKLALSPASRSVLIDPIPITKDGFRNGSVTTEVKDPQRVLPWELPEKTFLCLMGPPGMHSLLWVVSLPCAQESLQREPTWSYGPRNT